MNPSIELSTALTDSEKNALLSLGAVLSDVAMTKDRIGSCRE